MFFEFSQFVMKLRFVLSVKFITRLNRLKQTYFIFYIILHFIRQPANYKDNDI